MSTNEAAERLREWSEKHAMLRDCGGIPTDALTVLNALGHERSAAAAPPLGTRLILAHENLLDEWGARTEDGRRITVEWGEPDENGWYAPTFTKDGRNAEAAPLDVEALRQALIHKGFAYQNWHNGDIDLPLKDVEEVAAEYARLTERTDR